MVERSQAQFFGHPRGLSTLFFTEMWERFSYYGMRALLILFMTDQVANGGMGMGDSISSAIYGLYTFGVYALALPGGWIADRLIGQRRAVLYGGIIIALGHYTLAIPTDWAYYLGLVLVVIGTGLLKPNVSAIVGDLYDRSESARRDAGFSIFYMGINIGAFAGPLLCGYFGEEVNWHLGFSLAGIGMTFGLIQYAWGGKYLAGAGDLKEEYADPAHQRQAWRRFYVGLSVVAAIVVGVAWMIRSGAVGLVEFAQALGVVITVLAILYFAYIIFFGCHDRSEMKRVFVIFLLFLGAAMFWSGFEQAGSSMSLFADRETDRALFGWEVPTTWLQSVNPIFIILLAPVMGMLWVWLGDRNPSIPLKFGVGLVLLGVGFLVMSWGSTHLVDGAKVGMRWLVVTYFFHTVGELCLSPVGLSSVTKLAPERLVGQMMGTWFVGAALGNLIAGLVAGFIETMPLVGLFRTVAMIVIVAGFLYLTLAKPINSLTGGIK